MVFGVALDDDHIEIGNGAKLLVAGPPLAFSAKCLQESLTNKKGNLTRENISILVELREDIHA